MAAELSSLTRQLRDELERSREELRNSEALRCAGEEEAHKMQLEAEELIRELNLENTDLSESLANEQLLRLRLQETEVDASRQVCMSNYNI